MVDSGPQESEESMNPLNVMIFMKHLLAMVYAVCVTSAAFHFDSMLLLMWYLLILLIAPIGTSKNNNRKEG